MAKNIKYSEPASYFPKEVRKEFELGEYAKKKTTKKSTTKKKTK